MKTNYLRLSGALLFLSMSFATFSCAAELKSFNMHPAQVTVYDIEDNAIEVPNKSGKWVVVNYWADWCGPCKREIPDLNAFYKNNQDRAVFVSVHSDLPSQGSLQKMAKNLNIQFPILKSDPLKLVNSLEGTPSTYLVSPSGKVHGPLMGPQSERSLLKAMKRLD
jgi:thiol-disulfide isomerase/thioredoxin